MPEYGIFTDEGCIESGFWSVDTANDAAASYIADGEEVDVHVLCSDHEDQPAGSCEECNEEEPDDA